MPLPAGQHAAPERLWSNGNEHYKRPTSTIEIEALRGRFEGCITYRISGGPARTIAPGHRLHRPLVELLRVIGAEGHPLVTEYERELHEDVLAYEQEQQEHEDARLYGIREPRRQWRSAASPAVA